MQNRPTRVSKERAIKNMKKLIAEMELYDDYGVEKPIFTPKEWLVYILQHKIEGRTYKEALLAAKNARDAEKNI